MALRWIALLSLALPAGCRQGPESRIGTWENEINGKRAAIEITINTASGSDLLAARFDSQTRYFSGVFEHGKFKSRGDVPPDVRFSLFELARVRPDGDIEC
jgi:hypothetical protein